MTVTDGKGTSTTKNASDNLFGDKVLDRFDWDWASVPEQK